MSSDINLVSYASIILFTINLTMLSAIVQRDHIELFLQVFFKTTAACAIIHIALIFSGQIDDHFGRFLFLGNTHPNLGGEIYGIASFAGAASTKRSTHLAFSVPLLVSAFLMQSRTGLAVIALTVLLKIFVVPDGKVNGRTLVAGSVGAVIFVSTFMALPFLRTWFLDSVLLASDAQRGVSSGLVTGRDSQWIESLNYFLQSPIFGNGLSFYDESKRGAHNPIIYSLVYFGVLGLSFWALIAAFGAQLLRQNAAAALLLVPTTLMILLNDRFLNSNAFPLLYYFCIIQMSTPNSAKTTNLKRPGPAQ